MLYELRNFSFNNKLNTQLIRLLRYIDQADPRLTSGAKERFIDLMNDWQVYKYERDGIINQEIDTYNKMNKTLNLQALIIKHKR